MIFSSCQTVPDDVIYIPRHVLQTSTLGYFSISGYFYQCLQFLKLHQNQVYIKLRSEWAGMWKWWEPSPPSILTCGLELIPRLGITYGLSFLLLLVLKLGEIFLSVLQSYFLLKNLHFWIPIWSGIHARPIGLLVVIVLHLSTKLVKQSQFIYLFIYICALLASTLYHYNIITKFYAEKKTLSVWISIVCIPPFSMLYLIPKSPSGPPGLWLAVRRIPPEKKHPQSILTVQCQGYKYI